MPASYDDRRVWHNIDTQLKDELLVKLVSNLECSICSEIMHVPFLASCGHSFCYGCLDAWFETKVNCPTCRKDMDDAPILNISLRQTIKSITDLIIETLEDDKHRTLLKENRDQLIKDYEKASSSKALFGKAFSSAPTLVDTSDGVPRCGNCHWEAHGSQCLNCGAQFRHPRSDSYYDSEDGDAYNEDEDEAEMDGVAGREDAYDSQDSFVDDGDWADETSDQRAQRQWVENYEYVHDDDEEWELNRVTEDEDALEAEMLECQYPDQYDDESWNAHDDSPWSGLSDNEQAEEPHAPENRMRHLHLANNRLLNELDEQHESDVGQYNSERGRRRRNMQVVSSDEES